MLQIYIGKQLGWVTHFGHFMIPCPGSYLALTVGLLNTTKKKKKSESLIFPIKNYKTEDNEPQKIYVNY